MAGDKAHSPRQRTVRSVNRPDCVGLAGPDAEFLFQPLQQGPEPREWHDVPVADLDHVAADRLQAEAVVEAGHPQDLGQPHLPPAGQVLQDRAGQIAVGLR